MRGTAEVEPIDNRLFVLILQHPQEKREVLATAAATCAALLLKHLDRGPEIEAVLLDRLDHLIAEAGTTRPAQARKAARSNL